MILCKCEHKQLICNYTGKLNVYFQGWDYKIHLQIDTACKRNLDSWYFSLEGLNTTDDT